MDVSARSFLTSAVTVVSATTLALHPAVIPEAARAFEPTTVQLASAAEIFGPDLLDSAAVAAQSLGDDIEALYNAVEPWVAYGVNFLSWAVGWVPVAGLLAPQLIFDYDLGEAITQSLVFNTADLLGGTVSFSEALSNINTATTDAINAFINAEIGWIESMLPPAPPLEVDPGALADVGTLLGLVP